MPKLLIYSVGAVISTLVLVFVVAFLVDINRVPSLLDPLQEIQQTEVMTKPQQKGAPWLHLLDKDQRDDFYFPVTEIIIDLDLEHSVDSKYKNRARHFRLVTQILNDYHYFCLKQVLDQSRVKHKVERFNNDVAVILYSQDYTALNSIVQELKKYEIQSTLKEILN